jgi:hypothetical protein
MKLLQKWHIRDTGREQRASFGNITSKTSDFNQHIGFHMKNNWKRDCLDMFGVVTGIGFISVFKKIVILKVLFTIATNCTLAILRGNVLFCLLYKFQALLVNISLISFRIYILTPLSESSYSNSFFEVPPFPIPFYFINATFITQV